MKVIITGATGMGVSTLRQVALAMINTVLKGYPKNILEVKDINQFAKE